MKLLIALLLLSTQAFALEVEITDFYTLNTINPTRDTAAEVCFRVTPAPLVPRHVQVVADKGSRVEGNYSTWVDNRGSACLIISARSRVRVVIPAMKLTIDKSL